MVMPGDDANLSDRLSRLATKIDEMKAQVGTGLETETVEHLLELGGIVHRHAEIEKKASSLGAVPRGRKNRIAAQLATELHAVERSLQDWAVRRGDWKRP